ncbi:hypothetical protein [Streptomyces sp. NBC_00091]|uniref:hypothetical protein n=1 Tax=Streptomyces sp. NBC_00091 TaxID=2975648 RepID=UPI002254A0B6|nr:hypothetical protein [Streptomyces sp. NBC_00091]MCX5380591.1 hypothetical protein [Streptomyces sp. NBC_00091]
MYRFLGHFGAGLPAHRLRAAAAQLRTGPPGGLCLHHGEGWALAAGRASALGDVTAVLDGEIDNRLALATRLEVRGHAVADRNDPALLRSAFELDGAEFAAHLEGGYAAAVVDARAEPVLVLATDAAGTTPLYYHWEPGRGRLCFASDVPALLALLPDPPGLWEPGLDAYLTTGAPLDGRTLIEGVRMLPPGTTAVCSHRTGLRLVRRAGAARRTVPAPGTAAGARERLLEQVRRRSGGAGPLCVLGSGGPGAELVAELAGAARPELASVGVPDGGVPGSGGLDPARLPELLPELAWRLGQPDPDPAALRGFALFEAARRAGFRTALATDPVEELAEGRRRVGAAVRAGSAAAYADTLGPVPAGARSRLYSSEYRAYLAGRGDAARSLAERLGGGAELAGAAARFELEVLLPARGLRRLAHLSAAHGVRARLPLSPRRAWAALPAAGPGAAGQPVTALLTRDGPLAALALEVLSPGRLRSSGLLDPAAVGSLLAAQFDRPSDRLAATVWSLLMFELWREEYAVAVRRPARPAEVLTLTAAGRWRAGPAAGPAVAAAAAARAPG